MQDRNPPVACRAAIRLALTGRSLLRTSGGRDFSLEAAQRSPVAFRTAIRRACAARGGRCAEVHEGGRARRAQAAPAGHVLAGRHGGGEEAVRRCARPRLLSGSRAAEPGRMQGRDPACVNGRFNIKVLTSEAVRKACGRPALRTETRGVARALDPADRKSRAGTGARSVVQVAPRHGRSEADQAQAGVGDRDGPAGRRRDGARMRRKQGRTTHGRGETARRCGASSATGRRRRRRRPGRRRARRCRASLSSACSRRCGGGLARLLSGSRAAEPGRMQDRRTGDRGLSLEAAQRSPVACRAAIRLARTAPRCGRSRALLLSGSRAAEPGRMQGREPP
jgi:hypothetical protein